ncbi:MAG TPA: hypothetical protein VGC62_08235 [Pseudomonas sp.]|uniref:hypothetical protein n=1 Tax=Pseudomonas sp. TaxID=306 RepID=UPI002ED81AF1
MIIPISEKTVLNNVSLNEKKAPEALAGADTTAGTREISPTVSISGKALLMKHVFDSENSGVEPPVIAYREGSELIPAPLFLNAKDREVLAQIYEFAYQEGVDPAHVNQVALGLAYYRQNNDGQRISPLNQGFSYDLEGHQVSYSFTEKDAVTAKRILEGTAINSSLLDKNYVRHVLDKNRSALQHPDFEFMEQVINKFSSSNIEIPPLGTRFAKYVEIKNNYIKHLSAQTYDLRGGRPVEKDKARSAPNDSTKTRPENLQTVLRQIMAKYLEKSGLPTLFETIARLRR